MGVATISLILLATTLVAGIDQASGVASVDILDVVLSLKKEVTELTRQSEEQNSKIAQQDRRIALQDNEIAQQARRIAEQKQEISFLKKKRVEKESDTTQLKKKIVEQENVVTELKRKDNEHEDMVEELKRNAGNQGEETKELRKAMQQQHDSHRVRGTSMRIIKLKLFPFPVRLHSGSCKLKFYCYFTIVSDIQECVHNLEPCETPSHSASHQAPNYAQHSKIKQNI